MNDEPKSLATEFKSALWGLHVADNRLDAQKTSSWVNANRLRILQALQIAEIVKNPTPALADKANAFRPSDSALVDPLNVFDVFNVCDAVLAIAKEHE
jgi:hypothetical protein